MRCPARIRPSLQYALNTNSTGRLAQMADFESSTGFRLLGLENYSLRAGDPSKGLTSVPPFGSLSLGGFCRQPRVAVLRLNRILSWRRERMHAPTSFLRRSE